MKLKLKILVGLALGSFVITVGSVVAGSALILKRNVDAQVESNSGLGSGKLGSLLDQGSAGAPNGATTRAITISDVAIHNSSSNCWIVINNSIYDVTSFLNSHPGGSMVITPYCGKEATNAFNTKDEKPAHSHSQTAINMLAQYFLAKIGDQVPVAGNTADNTNPGATPNSSTAPLALRLPTTTLVATPTPTPTPKSTSNSGSSGTTLTLATVATHNSSSNCWIIISNNIYDVTTFLNSHPGGVTAITPYCGKEATNAFNTKDRNPGSPHSAYAVSLLNNYFVGAVGSNSNSGGNIASNPTPTPTPTPTPVTTGGGARPTPTPTPTSTTTGGGQTLSTATVATHNSSADCWIIISNSVYNVTSFLVQHPGGVGAITPYCGKEATNAFKTKGGNGSDHSARAYAMLPTYFVGTIGTTTTNPTPTPVTTGGGSGPTPTPTPTPTSGGSCTLPPAVCTKYPTGTLYGRINYEDNGSAQLKVRVGGSCRDIQLNSSGQITADQPC